MALTIDEIGHALGLAVVGDSGVSVTGIAGLDRAGPGDLTFLFSPAWRTHLATTRASAVLLTAQDVQASPVPCLVSAQPRLAWARVAALFDRTPVPDRQIHANALVADTAIVGQRVSIGPGAVIEDDATLGDDVTIGSGCVVGARVHIETGTRLFPNVCVYHDVSIGQNCLIHAGAVIGADGFGFEFDPATASLVKIPQVYSVQIGNNVEIGACTTIDRGGLNDTVIADGVKLDNQVQVGHGTSIGAHTAISGRTAIAGSTKIGSYCLIGGAVGIIDNIEIADRVEVTAMSLVSRSITASGRYSSGTGLMPSSRWKRSVVGFAQLDSLIKRIRKLEGN